MTVCTGTERTELRHYTTERTEACEGHTSASCGIRNEPLGSEPGCPHYVSHSHDAPRLSPVTPANGSSFLAAFPSTSGSVGLNRVPYLPMTSPAALDTQILILLPPQNPFQLRSSHSQAEPAQNPHVDGGFLYWSRSEGPSHSS